MIGGMDQHQKRRRHTIIIVAANFTIFAGYLAFGARPGFAQIITGGAIAIAVWAWCAYEWWKPSAADSQEPPPDPP